MAIKRLTPSSHIDHFLLNLVDSREQAAVRSLCYIGERCLVEARTNGSYTDRTGNLRSSIGYVVVVNGRIAHSGGFAGTDSGAAEGKGFASTLVAKFPRGICLIVVAGMSYASYVAARGYNVLDSSELLASRLVPQLLRELGFGGQ